MLICTVVVPDGEGRALLAHLRSYVQQRIEGHGIARILGLGFVASSKRAFDAMVVVDNAIWSLPEEAPVDGRGAG